MTNLDQNMQTILETLKQKAANTSSIAELERLVLKPTKTSPTLPLNRSPAPSP
jgi:hypothetical protein